MAASALRCTSSASDIGSILDDGESGDSSPPGLAGMALGLICVPVGLIGSGRDIGLRGTAGLVGTVWEGGVTETLDGVTRFKDSERLGLNGLMGVKIGRMGDSSSDMSGMMEIWGAGGGPSASSAPNKLQRGLYFVASD